MTCGEKIVKAERRIATLTERGEMWAQYNEYKTVHKQLARVKPEKRELFEQRHSRELILYDAAARYLKELKDSGEAITPKEWRREIDLLTAQKQVDSIDMKAMREELKAVERLRKAADQLARQERDKPRDRGRSGKGYGALPTPFRCVAFHDTLLHTEKPPYRFPHTAADGLFAEQVAVCAGAGQRQHQNIIFYAVDKQPVRENMTFPMACPIAGQVMVTVLIRQRFAHRQQRYDLLQQLDLQATLDGSFVVFFETGRVLDGIFGFFHLFRSANNSSRSL